MNILTNDFKGYFQQKKTTKDNRMNKHNQLRMNIKSFTHTYIEPKK